MLDIDKIAEKALALEAEGKKGEDGEKPESEGEEPEDDKAIAAGEVFDAVKAGDREAFGAALGAYVKLCLAKQALDEDDDY